MEFKRYRCIAYQVFNEYFIFDKCSFKAYHVPSLEILNNVARRIGVNVKIMNRNVEPLEHLAIALTHKCNLKCKYCFIDQLGLERNVGLSLEMIDKVLHEAVNLGLLTITLTGGEPFLYKQLLRVIEKATALDLVVRAIETNGLFIPQYYKKLYEYRHFINSISISVDGPKHIHSLLRGDNTFERVIDAIKILTNLEFKVVINTTMNRYITSMSCKELEEFLNYLADIGVIQVNFLQLFAFNNSIKELTCTLEELTYFAKCLGSIYNKVRVKVNVDLLSHLLPQEIKETVRRLNKDARSICEHFRRSLYIRADGDVVPCSIWSVKLCHFGNIKDMPLEAIWRKILSYRSRLTEVIVKLCSECSYFKSCLCGLWNTCIVAGGCPYGLWKSEVAVGKA